MGGAGGTHLTCMQLKLKFKGKGTHINCMQFKCMRFKCVEGGRYRHRSSGVLRGGRGRNCAGGHRLGSVGDLLNRSSGVLDLGSSGVGDRGRSVLGRVGGILGLR